LAAVAAGYEAQTTAQPRSHNLMSTAVATLPRRRFLLDEGEKILVSRDVLTAAKRLMDFVHETGISPEDIVTDPVVAIPVPIHARGKRFDTVEPDSLWNPLFWLPEDVALRIRIRETEHAEPRPETDAEWAIRIALELTGSGLYTPEEGWVDVFALYGINPDDPGDLEAIQAWQAGLPEERLDAIDLRQHVTFSDDNEAFEVAQEMYPLLMSAQWAFTAARLIGAIEEDPAEIASFATLGAAMLDAEPSDAPDRLAEAADALNDGGAPAEHGPKVLDALDDVLRQYVDAIAQLDQL